jgi:hypothetical protein
MSNRHQKKHPAAALDIFRRPARTIRRHTFGQTFAAYFRPYLPFLREIEQRLFALRAGFFLGTKSQCDHTLNGILIRHDYPANPHAKILRTEGARLSLELGRRDQSRTQGLCHRSRAGANLEFTAGSGDMRQHGVLADTERVGDLVCSLARGTPSQYLSFAR